MNNDFQQHLVDSILDAVANGDMKRSDLEDAGAIYDYVKSNHAHRLSGRELHELCNAIIKANKQ